ncbi:MAG: cytochrome c maturation protein CcmE [Alphaproteobacteria bacterium]
MRKRRRLYAVLTGAIMLAIAVTLVLTAFEDSIVFFYSPSDLAEKQASDDPIKPGQLVRVGGLVEEGSKDKAPDGVTNLFIVTDLKSTLKVAYKGILPDLFREGQGVVSSGALNPEGVFIATEVLAKHDETYMPPEVADALKRAGEWKGDSEKEKAQ